MVQFNYKPPQSIVRKIMNEAPSNTTSENYGRKGGYLGDADESSRAYHSVLVYVQKGLGEELELLKQVVKLILRVQKDAGIKYPLLPMSFGWGEDLHHEKKYFDLDYLNDWMLDNKITKVLSRVSGSESGDTPAIIPALFPKTDNRSLYTGKIKVNYEDLLVIIGKKDEVFFNAKLKPKLTSKIRKHILFVEIDNENIQWYFKNYEPKYINVTDI